MRDHLQSFEVMPMPFSTKGRPFVVDQQDPHRFSARRLAHFPRGWEHLTSVNVALGCVAAFALKHLLTPAEKLKAPLPPGPKAWPVLGNLLDMPPPGGHDWMHWAKHNEQFGELFVA